MRKPAIAILILLVAAMAAWWGWANRGPDSNVADVEIEAAGEDDAGKLPEPASGRVADPKQTGDSNAREAVTAGAPGSGARKLVDFEIHVKRLSDKQVVAGARVAICDFAALMASYATIQGRKTPVDKDAAREKVSHIACTDARGIVSVRLPIERAVIIVTHEGLYGRRVLTKSQAGRIDVLLDDDRSLRVIVLTRGTRKPVPAVPVGLYANRRSQSLVTDAAGTVSFAHVQESLRDAKDGRVGLALPLREPVRHPVALARLPQEPIELLLPPTGSVALRFRDEKGKDVDCSNLRMSMEAFVDQARQQKLPRARPMVTRLAEKGRARSGPMDLGLHLRLRVEAREPESARRPVEIDFDGPRRLEEVVEQAVLWPSKGSPGASWPVLTGRFVRNDGKPWVKTHFNIFAQLFPYDPDAYRTQSVNTDGKGRFGLILSIPCPPGGKRIYHIQTRATGAEIAGELDASRDYPDGDTDIGDVLLDQGRLVVSGRVVDQAGQPIPRAMLRVAQRVQTNHRVLWPTYAMSGSHASKTDGSFACYQIQGHDLPKDSLRLEVWHPETKQRQRLPIALGQQGVRVEFALGGGLEGSLLLGDQVEAGDVSVLLLSKPGSGRSLKLQADGSFEATGIAPGLYTVSVTLRAASRELRNSSRTSIEDIRILSGETNSDPRLKGIRLATAGKKLRIHIQDEAGKPITKGRVELLKSSWRDFVRFDHRGLAVIFVPKLPVGLRVSSYGYSVVEIPAVDSDRTVTLARGLRVRLVTKAKTAGKDPDYSLGGFIYHVREDGRTGRRAYGQGFPHEKVSFDSNRQIECMLPAPGTYEFHPWFYFQSKDNIGRGGSPKMAQFPRFTVRHDPKLQIFQVHIPEAAIQAELQRVRQRDTHK